MRRAFAALYAVLAVTVAGVAQADAPRTSVPIHQRRMPDGALRYWIPMRIGGTDVEAMLDSGSTGVRVFPGVLKDAEAACMTRRDVMSFGSGIELSGVICSARVEIGGQAPDAPIPVQRVDAKRCKPDKPCQAAGALSLDDFGIGGDGIAHAGFKVIVGVSLSDTPTANPLRRIGDRAWIIVLPRPGDTADGELILNPTAEDRAGFALQALDPQFSDVRGAFHDAIAGCLVRESGRAKICGPTVLDTGAPGVKVDLGAGESPLHLSPGEAAVLAFAGPGEQAELGRFTVGRGPGAFVAERPGDGRPRSRIRAGTLPYYAFSVLYDDKAGKIGLKPR